MSTEPKVSQWKSNEWNRSIPIWNNMIYVWLKMNVWHKNASIKWTNTIFFLYKIFFLILNCCYCWSFNGKAKKIKLAFFSLLICNKRIFELVILIRFLQIVLEYFIRIKSTQKWTWLKRWMIKNWILECTIV